MSENPLKQYFRTAAIHLDLPSKGKFYPDDTLEMPETGEVEVFPMTALDEITYKTPDALFNGSAVVDVIQSCIPAIKNAWEMPIIDLTAVLTAIRIASFGHQIDIETKCPECGEKSDYGLDLRNVLDSVTPPDYSKSLSIGDLKIMYKPMSYRDLNENSKLQFEEAKIEQLLVTDEAEMSNEEQLKIMSDAFKKVSLYTLTALSNNISKIITPDVTVSDNEHIVEFLENCERDRFKLIKKEVTDSQSDSIIKPLHIKCIKCEHEYDEPFTLDMSSFFAQD